MIRPELTDAIAVACWVSGQLDGEGIPCAITVALALAVHGVPRMTKDADIAVFVEPGGTDRLLDALARAGCRFERSWAAAEIARIGGSTRAAARSRSISSSPSIPSSARRWPGAFVSTGPATARAGSTPPRSSR